MANDFRSARFWAREIAEAALSSGSRAIDATMGNGHDAQWLCEAVGESGRVYAFDVQPEAVNNTDERLRKAELRERAELICAGHETMAAWVHEPVDLVMFNLGWLPGALHGVTTKTETTLAAVEAALGLLKGDGLLIVCIYPGHEEGAREKHALLAWARTLDPKRYDVLLKCYLNQPNDPPLMLAVRKLQLRGKREE